MDLDTIREHIKSYEGVRNKAYDDDRGNRTVGIGFNLERSDAEEKIANLGLNFQDVYSGKVSLTDAQVNQLFDGDVNQAVSDARAAVSNFDELSSDRQTALADMAFNLGGPGLESFRNMISAVEQGDFSTAADEMKDSDWYGQVGGRAKDDIDLMQDDPSS